jgi:glycosyltransferase involved in cell wall biosynthesis
MSKAKKRKILFIYQIWSSFIKHDLELLSKHFQVTKYQVKSTKKIIPFLIDHIKLFFFLLLNHRKFDIIYTWFGDYYSFTAGFTGDLFGISQYIVVGGNDAVSIPSIGYGVFSKTNLRSRLVKKAYKKAKSILAVDDSLIQGVNHYAPGNNVVGLENLIPGIKSKCIVIPTGYDTEKWKCLKQQKRQQILSVAIIGSGKRAQLKGFDFFIEIARKFPNYKFVFIGVLPNATSLDYNDVKNLEVYNKVEQEQLRKYYCESKVYLQLSLSEGLPNALCEAMLCECIPVGSAVNGIPNCIGDTGYILQKKNLDMACELIDKAMNTSPEKGKLARKRVIELFPENQREIELVKIIEAD